MTTTTPAQVISVSRRTDIAAFYTEWFMNRMREGFVCYRNPFGGEMYEVSLKLEDVMAFVFWSRNYAPLLPYLPELDQRGYDGYFHFTITDYGQPLERFAPPTQEMIAVFKSLAEHYSPKHVLWRFDPIIFSNKTPKEYIVEKFTTLAEQLSSSTERCYISFVDFYRKTEKNLATLTEKGFRFYDPTLDEKLVLIEQLVEIGKKYKIGLYACCEQEVLQVPGIQQAHCVDPLLIHALFPQKFRKLPKAPTRTGCGCYASRDIGAYDTCICGCLYCYANSSYEKALVKFRAHDLESSCLGE
jgi:hypothetical protein